MGRTLILAGDIGGTKSYLGLFAADPADFTPLAERRYATRDYPDLAGMLAAFIAETGEEPRRLVLGIPAPVNQFPVRPVNLPWVIDLKRAPAPFRFVPPTPSCRPATPHAATRDGSR